MVQIAVLVGVLWAIGRVTGVDWRDVLESSYERGAPNERRSRTDRATHPTLGGRVPSSAGADSHRRRPLRVSRLLRLPGLGKPIATVDGILGTMIHTEVSWFDEHGKLRIKPDITILEPGQLSVIRSMRKGYPLPNKGFNFEGGSMSFELKFIRNRARVTSACTRAAQRDLDEIRGLFDKIAADDGGDDLY